MSDVRLHVVARAATEDLVVHLLGDQVLVAGERNLAELRGEHLEIDPLRAAGLLHCDRRTIQGVYGTSREVWLVAAFHGGNELSQDLYAWRGDRWVHVPTTTNAITTIVPWTPGRLLAVDVLRGKAAVNWWFVTWGDTKDVPVPELCPGSTNPDGSTAPGDRTRMGPRDVLAFPSGAVFVAGQDECGEGRALVERWGPGASGHAAELLAGTELEALAGLDEHDVFVGGDALLAHFDGKAWTPLPVPFALRITSLAVTVDHTLWVAARGPRGSELWTRDAGGRWANVALPAGVDVKAVKARAVDDVWVEAGATLLRTRAPDRVLEMPERCIIPLHAAQVESRDDVRFVLLPIKEGAPADAAWSEAARVLARFASAGELRGVEVVERGRRAFGIAGLSSEEAEKLVAHWRTRRGDRPTILAASPWPEREIVLRTSDGTWAPAR